MSITESDKNFDICIHIREHKTRKYGIQKLILLKMIIYGTMGILMYSTLYTVSYLSYIITFTYTTPLFSWRNFAGWIGVSAVGYFFLLDIEVKTHCIIYKLIIYGIYGMVLALIYMAISNLTFTWFFLVTNIILASIFYPYGIFLDQIWTKK